MSAQTTSRIWLAMENLGDGSARAVPFLTKEQAEAHLAEDDERFCDDVTYIDVAIEHGAVVSAS